MNEKKTAILISGMHRGGTSSIANAVHLLGAGLPAHLMPARADNPRGFFESEKIMAFNDRVLAESGTSWSDWRSLNKDWSGDPQHRKYVDEAGVILTAEYGDAEFIAIKDPRFSKILPLWIYVLEQRGYRVCHIIPFRHPDEVAASLLKRNATPESLGRLIWLQHMLDAEHYSRGQARVFIFWDEFIRDWEHEARKMAIQLNISWPRLNDVARADIAKSLSPELKHHRASAGADVGADHGNSYVTEAFAALKLLEKDPDSSEGMRSIGSVRSDFERTERIFGPAIAAADASRSCAIHDRDAATAELGGARNHIAALLRERDSALIDGSALTVELIHTRGQLQAAVDARDSAREKAGRECAALAEELQRTVAATHDFERQSSSARRRLAIMEGSLREFRNFNFLRKVLALLFGGDRYVDPLSGTAEPLELAQIDGQLAGSVSQVEALDLKGLLGLNGTQFLVGAYGRLLKRMPDEPGLLFYQSRLLLGVPKIEIIRELAGSKEAREAGTALHGLSSAWCKHGLAKVPVFGLIVRHFSTIEGNSPSERRLRAMEQALYLRKR